MGVLRGTGVPICGRLIVSNRTVVVSGAYSTVGGTGRRRWKRVDRESAAPERFAYCGTCFRDIYRHRSILVSRMINVSFWPEAAIQTL